MKKASFIIAFLFIFYYSAIAQHLKKDTTNYTPKSLTLDEINLVSGYYAQNGDHSSVEGGIGSELVHELSTTIDLKFVGYSNPDYIHTLTFGMGYAHHTSASQAWISTSGASKTRGDRFFPSFEWSMQDVKHKTEFSLGSNYSGEYNYQSLTFDGSFSKKTNTNGEFSVKLTTSLDQVLLILPSEFRTTSTSVVISSASTGSITSYETEREHFGSSPRNTYTAAFAFNQVINARMQGALLFDVTQQTGFLGLPFHRVYFTNGTDKIENLPKNRTRIPVAARLNYFLGDNLIIRTYYRYYADSWGIKSNTAMIETPIKLSPFFSISPFYRYYQQTAARYFAPYMQHATTDTYFTSNYSYSAFSANFFGADVKWMPLTPIGGFIKSIELRYGHYKQTTGLVANVVTLHLKF